MSTTPLPNACQIANEYVHNVIINIVQYAQIITNCINVIFIVMIMKKFFSRKLNTHVNFKVNAMLKYLLLTSKFR